MSESFGPGVSRTLSALQRQFSAVVWQKGKPPCDAELSLIAQIANEQLRQAISAQMHSGFLIDPTRANADFVTDPSWSNFLLLGRQATGEDAPIVFANVNGWIIPVTGTAVSDGDTSNRVNLSPPPASDARIDLVFLEAWTTLVAPNPSEVNKPSASTLWRYGNVEFGGTNITDDLEDPAIGFETTERVQVQYRIRLFGAGAGLGSSVALDVYPDGIDDPNVLGQGTSTDPVAGMTFTNMRETLGDPSLWRAGDGDPSNDLGTTDGYVYAVPICAIFRRNSSGFEAVEPSGAANQNGGLDRNPSASTLPDPRDGAKVLTTATLTNAIDETATGVLAVTGLSGSGFDDPSITLSSTFIVLDGEVIGPLTAVGATTVTVGASARGRNGTMASPHAAGVTVRFFNPRADGLFSDQITGGDVLDLRRGVTLGDWDYQRLLIHNLAKLVQGQMRTSYKQSSSGDTEGVQVVEVGYLLADGATSVPPSTVAVDGPDGVRTVFSDSAALQAGVTVLCEAPAAAGTVAALDAGVAWDVAADFRPSGFITAAGYANGTSVFLSIGGSNGSQGARGTFRAAGTQAVRFVAPFEFWKTDVAADATTGDQTPVRIRFVEADALQPAAYGETASAHPGPMYPQKSSNFEAPFIVLGGPLNSTAAQVGSVALINNSPGAGQYSIQLPGLNFDAAGGWYPTGDLTSLDPSGVTNPVLRGQRTLYDMLTKGGTDRTGLSSEVYLVLYGDSANPANCGAFQVIGAGTIGYTSANASAADRVRIRFLSAGVAAFVATGASITAEMRSQYTNAEDGPGGSSSGAASLAIVFTDVEGTLAGSKWPSAVTAPVQQKMVISTSLLYHPGRGATARVPDTIWRISGRNLGAEYLRESPASRDSTFPSQAGVPGDETYFDVQHVQAWNRLTSLGMSAPDAPDYGGAVQAFSEQSREAEAFVDRGSKTLVFRPFLDRSMTLQARTSTAGVGDTLLGPSTYPGPIPPVATPKDGAAIWTTGLHMGFEVPPEFMPRFGRQDIPYHTDNGTFLPGINHLFTDSTDVNEPQSYIIGGQDSTNTTIRPMFIQTGGGLQYGQYGTIIGPGTPAYQGRLYSSETVISSDLGRGMKGIQLPPYLGVARLYGVYDSRDFLAKGGATFNSDRVTPSADPATNLLRTDATKQTLFILQGGAEDATGDADDHTYIVPENAINIQLSPTYVTGETFDDLDYVVEFCAFGYSRGFINKNNYVLVRRHKGNSTLIVDGGDPEADGARMTIPSPAPADAVYVGFTRTPYQGDPYMTRAGETRTVTDYEARYGQVSIPDQFLLGTSIQQFDSNGELIPETPNRRALQVLAAVDFHTTLGTGKIGGQLYFGTPLDAGFTENTTLAGERLPPTNTAPAWRVLTRAFSEGQRVNTSHATLGIEVANNATISGSILTFTIPNETTPVTLTAGVDYVVGGSASVTATNLAVAIAANATLNVYLTAKSANTTIVTVMSREAGASGNGINVAVSSSTAGSIDLLVPRTVDTTTVTAAYLSGGVDQHVNGGNGTSQLDLTGMTERLPLGILLQDSDFLCENPLLDNSSALQTQPPGIQPVQSLLPLAEGGQEYTRFLGGPGQWVGMSDGGILEYEAFDATSAPTGTKRFRLYRGGGSAFVLTDPTPGGPIDWVSGSFPANLAPVLKGGVLVCKALLVRNLHEEAFSLASTTTQGDEVQMVVLTYGILGKGDTQHEGVVLSGVISPTGYGEGYAAADRYRLEGRPMSVGRARELSTFDAEPAVFPGSTS